MPASPLIGAFDGASVRLWEAEAGRLAVDDLAAGSVGDGWVEPADLVGTTALVRASTAGLTPAAVAELLVSVLEQARAAGAEVVVWDTDDERAGGEGMVRLAPFRVTNSLGRRVERVVTLDPGKVGMYSCGPTVYSYQHIGNMRSYVFADTLKRALRWRGLDVHHVINITDVGHLLADADQGEDKVEEASRAEGRTVEEITSHYTDVFWADLQALGVQFPEDWPKASLHVPQMVNFAAVLEDHGYGYRLPHGLYFDTSLQADYGALAGIDTGAQRETGRVDAEGKRAKSDFALWRTFTDERPRLMEWESPWGRGAPGWHLECSVMSMSLLGEHFDLHTGGIDHRELHHVNEIAQSEAYLEDGLPWVRYWVHGEFLTFKDSKMSKSAGGTIRLADLVAMGVHPLAFRYLLLQSHYGSQLEYSDRIALAAHQGFKRLALGLRSALGEAAGSPGLDEPITVVDALDQARALGSAELEERLLALDEAVADDLGTPRVMALVHTWAREPGALPGAEWEVLVRAVNAVTGLSIGRLGAGDFVPPLPDSVDVDWVEDRLEEREAARAARDWGLADRMRDELTAAGIRVEDTADGTHWYYAGEEPG